LDVKYVSFCIIVIGTVLHESKFYANPDRYVLMHRHIQQSRRNASRTTIGLSMLLFSFVLLPLRIGIMAVLVALN
jgi:hypothetical protein